MANTDHKARGTTIGERRKESTDEIELRPDGERRFIAAVHAAAKSGPKHRKPK